MSNIFIIHGVGGHPEENWFPWVKKELESLGHEVYIPQFPTPENQTLENWLKVIENYKDQINEETILIGHSLGVPFILNLLEKYRVKASFLVAGFCSKCDNEFDEGTKTFSQRNFDWSIIKNNCNNFFIYHSDNDPYIKLEKAQEVSNELEVEITLIKNAGHINRAAGFTEFQKIVDDIKTLN